MAGGLFDVRRDGQARTGLRRASPGLVGVAVKGPHPIRLDVISRSTDPSLGHLF